jgi:flagellar biosynthesis/type III secretory pathway M-ring protein FliF/YscJ
MLIFLVVRPLLRRLLPPPGGAPAALDGPGSQALPAGGARALTDGGRPPALAAPGEGGDDDGVALDPATRKRGELIKRARSVIEQSPDEAAAVLRTWLQES